MPTDAQTLAKKLDALAQDVNYMRGKFDYLVDHIATREEVQGCVDKAIAAHTSECWHNATYAKSQRMKENTIGRPSLAPKSNKGMMTLYALVASMGGALVLVIKWLIGTK